MQAGPGADGKEEKLGVGTGNPILPQMPRAALPTRPRFLTPREEPVSKARAGTVYPCVGASQCMWEACVPLNAHQD